MYNYIRTKHFNDNIHVVHYCGFIAVDVMLVTLLDSGDKEVVYIACGVLINFMVDEEKRNLLKKEKGITKYVFPLLVKI